MIPVCPRQRRSCRRACKITSAQEAAPFYAFHHKSVNIKSCPSLWYLGWVRVLSVSWSVPSYAVYAKLQARSSRAPHPCNVLTLREPRWFYITKLPTLSYLVYSCPVLWTRRLSISSSNWVIRDKEERILPIWKAWIGGEWFFKADRSFHGKACKPRAILLPFCLTSVGGDREALRSNRY